MKTTNSTQSKIQLQTIFNVFSIIALLSLFSFTFLHNDKIAYVDSAKIMSEYKGAVKARKEYDAKVRAWQSNVDTLTIDVQNSMKHYERELASMSAREKSISQELLNTKQKQFDDYQKAIQENARQENAKLYKEIVSTINAFLLKYGKEHNYKIILIANQSGTIAYAREELDITSKVIEELNKQEN